MSSPGALLSGAVLLGLFASSPAVALEDSEMVAMVHVHTDVADGAAAPVDLARAARAAGLDALVVTDHFLERVSYAPWPLGKVLGVTLSRPSVVRFGIERYLRLLADAERSVPGILVVPGVEVTPYARFSGSLLFGSLSLNGWHRHLLVLGVEDPKALARLPVLGNRAGGVYSAWSLLFLAPALGLCWSIRRMARPGYAEARLGAFRIRRSRRPLPEAFLGAGCLVLLLAGFPFRVEKFAPVGADPGEAAYGDLIERVHSLGGIAVWAHPEARAESEGIAGIRLLTEPYADLVVRTSADGFGALPEGVRTLLPPGGLWDRALRGSLDGPRPGRPFALAEADEHRPAGEIDYGLLQTVLLVHEKTHAGLLEALRSGRFYARWTPEGRKPLRLRDFRVEATGRFALAGESLSAPGMRTIRFAVTGGEGSPVTTRLLRGGQVIWTRRAAPPIEAVVDDALPVPTYYRLDVEGAYPYRLVSNAVTVFPAGRGT